jgi:hypothetical protein
MEWIPDVCDLEQVMNTQYQVVEATLPTTQFVRPCVWRQEASVVRAVSIPRYNRENSGYIEKYQSILSLFD